MKKEMLEELRAPFPPDSIGHKPTIWCAKCRSKDVQCPEHKQQKCRTCGNKLTTAHNHLDFVGHAYVRERFNEVDPDWNWEPMAYAPDGLPMFDGNGGMWIRLTIGGKTHLGYGDAPGKRGGDAIKEVIGDALRNAGQSFGVALDMWKREPAVAPAAEASTEPVLSPEQRANEMRNLILALGKKKRMGLPAIDGDFATWTRGEKEFRTADLETLEQYKAYLEAVK